MHFHKEWKKICNNCPSFVFEYRFYTDHYCDPGYMRVANETYRDMKNLENVNFQGVMNDQTHRCFMPTSLPVLLMGETLFDKNIDLENYIQTYFQKTFGIDGIKCRKYLEALSDFFCPANIRKGGKLGVEDEGIQEKDQGYIKSWINNPEVANKMSMIPSLLDNFKSVISHNLNIDNKCQKLSWKYLEYHNNICYYLCEIYKNGALGNIDKAKKILEELELYISEIEMIIHRGFDLFLFIKFFRSKLDIAMCKYYD